MTTRRLRYGLTVVLACGLASSATDAQAFRRRAATREELVSAIELTEAAAKQAEGRTRTKLERDATVYRSRLQNGDFLPGRRIVLSVPGADSALSDTFTVRAEQMLRLPQLPEISLRGVLDSELDAFLLKELGRFIKAPTVTSTSLVRVELSGGIQRPGFHLVPVDMPVTDLIMAAGGPATGVNMRRAVVRRGTEVVADQDEVASMLQLGLTLSDLALRDGDEIILPGASAPGSSWATRIGPIMAVAGSVLWILRRR